jgi:hypothetical protein
VIGTLLAFIGAASSHAAGRAAGCVTFPDARGDAQPPAAALLQPPATEGVDIHAVAVRNDKDRLVADITVADISKQPVATSTRMAFSFILERWQFMVFSDVGGVPNDVAGRAYDTRGIVVNGEVVSQSVETTASGNTVRLAVRHSVLERLRGADVQGRPLTALSADVAANYGPRTPDLYMHQTFDEAQAPRAVTAVLGAACR